MPTGNLSVSTGCSNYADPALNNITDLLQQVYEGDIQGSLFQIPFLNAGKVKYALGADHRSEGFNFTPDSNYTFFQDYPVILQNIALPGPVQGDTSTTEVYTELSIPLLKDLPLVKSLEIDPGFRLSHYDESSQGSLAPAETSIPGSCSPTGRSQTGYPSAAESRSPTAHRTSPNCSRPTGGSSIASGADPCAVYAGVTPTWGNTPGNPNRQNVQKLCQYLIERDAGAGAAIAGAYMVPDPVSTTAQPAAPNTPGTYSADNYQYNVFGYSPNAFPFLLAVTGGKCRPEVGDGADGHGGVRHQFAIRQPPGAAIEAVGGLVPDPGGMVQSVSRRPALCTRSAWILSTTP